MAFISNLPLGFSFNPTGNEMVTYLRWRFEDPDDPNSAFIPIISMRDHEPQEFSWLGAVTGKDGTMYFYAEWDRYGKAGRLDRQVKNDSMNARWKEVSSETIKSSDGTQIATRKNLTFLLDGSSTDWHMEEYRLCTPEQEHSQVSLCRVSKKCCQAGRTTKIDAKVDIRFGEQRHFEEGQPYWCYICSKWYRHDETFHRGLRNLCNRLHDQDQTLLSLLSPILESFEYECHLPNNSKGNKKAGPSCISHTGNGPVDVGFSYPQANNFKGKKEPGPSCISHMDSGREMNEGQKDSDAPFGRNLYWGLHGPKETGYSYRDNLVGNPNIGNYQSANNSALDMNDGTGMVHGFLSDPDHSYPIWSNALEEYGHNPWTPSCLNANNTLPYMNDVMVDYPLSDPDQTNPIRSNAAEEYGHNPWTPSCPNANHTGPYMNDVMVDYLLSDLDQTNPIRSNAAEEYGHNPWTPSCPNANNTVRYMNDDVMVDYPLSDPDQTNPIRSNVGEEYLENLGTGYYQGADDTVPIDMDDAIRTGNCLLSPDDHLKDYFHKVKHLVPTTQCPSGMEFDGHNAHHKAF